MTDLLRAQACNNAWANCRLGQACSRLPPEVLAEDRGGFFGSIIATLNHILIVDWFYVSALEGDGMGPAAFEDDMPCPDIAGLVAAQREIDGRLLAIFDAPGGVDPGREVRLVRAETVQIERFDRTFLHLIQHQIHHRGQVHGLLSGTEVAPPQLDEFYMHWETDRQLRAPDFEALGWTEETVWPGRDG